MKPYIYTSVSAKQVSVLTVELKKLEATMNAGAAAALYLQIHDSRVTPTTGAVPLHSWLAAECGFKDFKLGELKVGNGLFIGLSSTAGTYTAAGGGSDVMDILNIELQQPPYPAGAEITSPPTTQLEVWADDVTNAAKKILAVDCTNTGAVPLYFQVFTTSTPSAGDVPVLEVTVPVTPSSFLFSKSFGSDGKSLFSQDADGTKHYGCFFIISSTSGYLTEDISGDVDATVTFVG